MLELQLPTRHEWITSDATYGKLSIEPFEAGFALTVGIAYRRVLLSAVHGAAPTWVKIENVLHEFSQYLRTLIHHVGMREALRGVQAHVAEAAPE